MLTLKKKKKNLKKRISFKIEDKVLGTQVSKGFSLYNVV